MRDGIPITDEQMAELRAFAAQEGHKWKDVMAYEYWWKGLPVRGFPTLYGLRNTHGNSWLVGFRFPKGVADA